MVSQRTLPHSRQPGTREEALSLLRKAQGTRWRRTTHPGPVLGSWYRYGRRAFKGWRLETRRKEGLLRYRLVPERRPAARRGVWHEVFEGLKRIGDERQVPQKPHAAVVAVSRWQKTHPDFFARVLARPQGGSVIQRRSRPPPKGHTRIQRLMALKVGEGFSDTPDTARAWRAVVSQSQRRNRKFRWRVRYRAQGRNGPSLEIIRVRPQRRRVARLPENWTPLPQV